MPDAKQARHAESREAPGRSAQNEQPVLIQRVIALNGERDGAAKSPKPVSADPVASSTPLSFNNPPQLHKQQIDLAATSLEWGAQQLVAAITVAEPAAPDDAEWATYSSIAMRPYEDLAQSLLRSNIEDAATTQYSPALASTITDLASLDIALEEEEEEELGPPSVLQPLALTPEREARRGPAQPQMLVLRASLVWTALGIFVACALLLALLVTASLTCRAPSTFELRKLRCVSTPQLTPSSGPTLQ